MDVELSEGRPPGRGQRAAWSEPFLKFYFKFLWVSVCIVPLLGFRVGSSPLLMRKCENRFN